MKRFFPIALVWCIALSSTICWGARLGVALAGAIHSSEGIALEALPVISEQSMSRISGSIEGVFSGQRLPRGLQFTVGSNTYDGTSTVQYFLNGSYDRLMGTFYSDDQTLDSAPSKMSILDVSDAAVGPKVLFSQFIGKNGQFAFDVSVHGTQKLEIQQYANTGSVNAGNYHQAAIADVVANLTRPKKYVTPTYPLEGAVLPTSTTLAFVWQSFSGASIYSFHIWMVKQQGMAAITPTSKVNQSILIFGKTSYSWNDKGYLPGTYQYDILPLDAAGNALGPRSVPVQIRIVG